MTEQEYIDTHQPVIEAKGYQVEEKIFENGEAMLWLYKGDERHGWGRFKRLACWSYAVEFIQK